MDDQPERDFEEFTDDEVEAEHIWNVELVGDDSDDSNNEGEEEEEGKA